MAFGHRGRYRGKNSKWIENAAVAVAIFTVIVILFAVYHLIIGA